MVVIRAALDFYLAQRLPCSAKGKNYLYIYYLLSSSHGVGYIAVLKWIRSQRLKRSLYAIHAADEWES